MARYIDADKLIADLKKNEMWSRERDRTEASITVNKQPTADVVEVKHAKWEINPDGYYPYCGNCRTEPKNGVMSKYCPECGAKMDR